MASETHLQMIRRHIRQGERHVASQIAVIGRLRRLGADTVLAEDLLEQFQGALAENERHLATALEVETRLSGSPAGGRFR